MVMTQRSSPNLSFSGIALIFSLASAGWLATPASSCPPSEGSAPKAAKCATIETTAPCVSVAGVPSAIAAPLPSGSRAVVVAGTPAPPVAVYSPVAGVPTIETPTPAIPAIAAFSPPAAPSLPGQLMLAGPTAPPARRSDNVDDRLERLERQLERLADQLERMGVRRVALARRQRHLHHVSRFRPPRRPDLAKRRRDATSSPARNSKSSWP